MGRLPSHIFVVRHGNRLDVADKQWHLTSPTPYDPPLTYGGFLQARLVGNQIATTLEKAKIDAEVTKNGAALSGKRRRFNIVIHSSPFLRCVQTSIGISSGLAQTAPESIYQPSDVIVSRKAPTCGKSTFKSTLLRLDPFLGEWLTPEYFEMITPPPGPALMIGSAKAELLRREEYSQYTELPTTNSLRVQNNALWSSPRTNPPPLVSPSLENDGLLGASKLTATSTVSQEKKGYTPLRPSYAISSSRKIPEGFVAHARDSCTVVDYQWDSMRGPLDLGDGGTLGEEWAAMHQRFRSGLKKLVNWYATANHPDELQSATVNHSNGNPNGATDADDCEDDDEEVETVVIIVSHGAGCNALIGAITHQPVLMDVGIASITVATRIPDVDYEKVLADTSLQSSASSPHVAVNELFQIRLSASTEHLRTSSGTPLFKRPDSPGNAFLPPGRRGRTSTISTTPIMGGPVLNPFTYRESLSAAVESRSSSAGTLDGDRYRRDSGLSRLSPGYAATRTSSFGNGNRSGNTPSPGLWAPVTSSLRLMDEDNEEAVEDFDSMLPDFGFKRFDHADNEPAKEVQASIPEPFPDFSGSLQLPLFLNSAPLLSTSPKAPVLAAPIKVNRELLFGDVEEEVPGPQLGAGLGGLWTSGDTLDMSHSKRRWTVNDRP